MPSIGDLCATVLIASVWLMGNKFGYRYPPHSGSLDFNYTNNFSVVLMALEDAEYWFRVVHIWDYSRSSDRGIFVESVLARGLEAWSWSCNLAWGWTSGKHALYAPKYASILDATSSQLHTVRGEKCCEKSLLHQPTSIPKKVYAIVLTACILHNIVIKSIDDQWWFEEQEVWSHKAKDISQL